MTMINVQQINDPSLVAPHFKSVPAIDMSGGSPKEFDCGAIISELLFKVQKDSSIFWVGAAVPLGTFDFTRTQVFFHPTVQ